ncbi:hypothetical protein C7441_112175 [Pseudaminobacter salicylatoxidans]|uniref:Uncharacterized protein n=1 Tax=Pseudaminobacter salicylatoxidans TaxID=93369 RepID=A0A316C027_PSESE|nr:hypothetical protein C7441_112175 [Pseudaminobacter salicylatoxidans]
MAKTNEPYRYIEVESYKEPSTSSTPTTLGHTPF